MQDRLSWFITPETLTKLVDRSACNLVNMPDTSPLPHHVFIGEAHRPQQLLSRWVSGLLMQHRERM